MPKRHTSRCPYQSLYRHLYPPLLPHQNHFRTGGGIKSSNPFSSAFASSNNLFSPRFLNCTYSPISHSYLKTKVYLCTSFIF